MKNRRKLARNFNKKNKKNKVSIFRIFLLLILLLWGAFLWYIFLLDKKILLSPEYHIISSSNKYINTDYFLDNWKNLWIEFSNKTNIIISSNSEKKPNVNIPRNFVLREYKVENIHSKYYHIFELEFINKVEPLFAVPNSSKVILEEDSNIKVLEKKDKNKNIDNSWTSYISDKQALEIKENNKIIEEKLEEIKDDSIYKEEMQESNNNELFLSGNINIDSLNEKRLEQSKYLREQEKLKELDILENIENLAIQKIEKDIWNDNLDLETLRKKVIKEQGLGKRSTKKVYTFTLWNKDDLTNKNFKINSTDTDILDYKLNKKHWNKSSQYNIKFKLNIINVWNLYAEYSNLDNNVLNNVKLDLIKKLEFLNNLNIGDNKVLKILNAQEIENNTSLLNLINNIIETRKEKYLTPVVWVLPSEAWYAVPNANRGYRSDITDWIHHGWDAYADIWHQIVSITDWVIIRIRDDFEWEDLDLINKEIKTDLEWDYNLDVFRWNQLWLKLADWNIVFYSHFSEFENNIYEWKLVKKWDILWKVWITWVPEKNYSNSHLHFAVMQNNLKDNLELFRYDFNDILWWDWLYRWLEKDKLIIKQRELFYTN